MVHRGSHHCPHSNQQERESGEVEATQDPLQSTAYNMHLSSGLMCLWAKIRFMAISN